MVRCVVNNELKRVCKEAVVAYFEVKSQDFSGVKEAQSVRIAVLGAEIRTRDLRHTKKMCYPHGKRNYMFIL
jgi:hypothetical protein